MASSQPNILLIMSDQHHAGVLGCAGDTAADTPTLDALAARGVRCASTYCPFPLCGPSRMSFMTGRHPYQLGIWDNSAELGSDVPTFAHALHAGGYDTVLAGRMHFVGLDQRHGFAQRILGDCPESAFLAAGWKLSRVLGDLTDTPGMHPNGLLKSGPGRTGYHAYDEMVTSAATTWLRQRPVGGRPFLLTVGYTSPHCPFIAPPEDFAHAAARIGLKDLPPWDAQVHPLSAARRRAFWTDPEPPVEARWRSRVAYYGLCRFLDRQIAAVLAALAASGQADDTVVIYTSDHGEMLGEHGMWWKSTLYEGGACVPLIAAGPSLARGLVVEIPVGLVDVAPTLSGLAGCAELPGGSGRSLLPLLRGEAVADRPVFCENVYSYDNAVSRMVRLGAWKLSLHHDHQPELYNLAEDPGERRDRAADPTCAEVLARLAKLARADGWDPEAIAVRMRRRPAEGALIGRWLSDVRPAEPDPLWFDQPPENYFDPSPRPSP